MSLHLGARLGAYEILSLLGSGGMGEVYLAQDTKLRRKVALKVLADSMAGDPDRRQRFEREAQAVAALNHPNLGEYDQELAGVVRYRRYAPDSIGYRDGELRALAALGRLEDVNRMVDSVFTLPCRLARGSA